VFESAARHILPALLSQADPPAPAARHFELLEQNAHIIYPLLGGLALLLVVLAVRQAWQARTADPKVKDELKRELMFELKRQVRGASTQALAQTLRLNPKAADRLLSEMEKDGLVSRRTPGPEPLWQVRGVGP
jgi:hypothetical protein